MRLFLSLLLVESQLSVLFLELFAICLCDPTYAHGMEKVTIDADLDQKMYQSSSDHML